MKEYKELLLEQERLLRKENQILNKYLKDFGDLMIRNYEIQIECIRLKSTIRFYQTYMNKKNAFNEMALENYIQKNIGTYIENLKEMKEDYHTTLIKPDDPISNEEKEMLHDVFEKYALSLHPILQPKLHKDPKAAELWDRLIEAYQVNGISRLEVLDKEIEDYLKDKELEEVFIPDVAQKTKKLKKELEQKQQEPPFTYEILFHDEKEKEKAIKEFDYDYKHYQKYLQDLKDDLFVLMKNHKPSKKTFH